MSFPDRLRRSYRFYPGGHSRTLTPSHLPAHARQPAYTGVRHDLIPQRPDTKGLFGHFGGQYVAETLMPLIHELAAEYRKAKADPEFAKRLAYFQRDYVGRPRRCTSPSA